MPRRSCIIYNFSLLLKVSCNTNDDFFITALIHATTTKMQQQYAHLFFPLHLLKSSVSLETTVSKINMKIFSLLFPYYQKKFANGQTTHHTDLHILPLSNSQAHSPLLSSPLVILNKFLYKPSFSIPRPSGIASFFHLISNFLTSHPLLSEKRSFLETILLHF